MKKMKMFFAFVIFAAVVGCGSESKENSQILIAAYEVTASPDSTETFTFTPLPLSKFSDIYKVGVEDVEIAWPNYLMMNSTNPPGAPSCETSGVCWKQVNVCSQQPCIDGGIKENKCCKYLGCNAGCVLNNLRWTITGRVSMRNRSTTTWTNPTMVMADFTGGAGHQVSVYRQEKYDPLDALRNFETDNPKPDYTRTKNPYVNMPLLTFGAEIKPGETIDAGEVLWMRDNRDKNDSSAFKFNAYVFVESAY